MSNSGSIQAFQKQVWDYYAAHGRHDLPWRVPDPGGSFDAYKILVSEIMLQQTQVPRVIPKYHEFLARFPTVEVLAQAPLADVLTVWSGLGYNRRAKFLHQAAQMVMQDFGGNFPHDLHELVELPGVGKNTAGAILAYAFNQPVAFLETNIRTVYTYHFFKDKTAVPDTKILELVGQTLDMRNPREWYWALMDYGAYLKKSVGNLNKLSKHYVRQSPFAGSRRQVRGRVLHMLAANPQSESALRQIISDERLTEVLAELVRENLVHQVGDLYWLGS